MDIESKLAYELEDGSYSLDYLPSQNALVVTIKTSTIDESSYLQGAAQGEIKFTPDTVDEYIASGLGGAFPAYVPELKAMVWSADELNRLELTPERRNEIIAQYPKLRRGMKSGMPDRNKPYEIVLDHVAVHSFDADSNMVEQKVILDYTQQAWLSPDRVPVTDIRTVLEPDQAEDVLKLFQVPKVTVRNEG